MGFELTKENLQNFGFDDENITKLLTWDNYDMFLFNDTCYYATNIEKKIYKDKTAYRKYYFKNDSIHFPLDCPDLINEYFDNKLNSFTTKRRKLLGNHYDWKFQTIEFINDEISHTKTVIETITNDLNKSVVLGKELKKDNIAIQKVYLVILENKLAETESMKVNKHVSLIVKENKDAIGMYFKEVMNHRDENKKANDRYFGTISNIWETGRKKELEEKQNLIEVCRDLKMYITHLGYLINRTAFFFEAIEKIDVNVIDESNILEFQKIHIRVFERRKEILYYLGRFDNFIKFIKYHIRDGNYKLAMEIQAYYLDMFDDALDLFKSQFHLFIERSPLNENFEETRLSIKNAINIERIKILNSDTKNPQPQQPETVKPDEVKKELHPEIFKGNSFEIWQFMFDRFKIKESSYSIDIDFMFQVMKYNNQIHDFIGLTDIKNWINKVYQISFEKIRYTNHKAKSNSKRLIIYDEIISK